MHTLISQATNNPCINRNFTKVTSMNKNLKNMTPTLGLETTHAIDTILQYSKKWDQNYLHQYILNWDLSILDIKYEETNNFTILHGIPHNIPSPRSPFFLLAPLNLHLLYTLSESNTHSIILKTLFVDCPLCIKPRSRLRFICNWQSFLSCFQTIYTTKVCYQGHCRHEFIN